MTEFEETVLASVRRLGSGAYGVSIHQAIEETGRSVAVGALWVAMERLETRGFVRSHWGEATPERGGRRKRYYEITPAGEESLREKEAA